MYVPLYTSPELAQLGKWKVSNPKVAGSSPLGATIFSSDNVHLLAYVFTDEGPQSELLKRDESSRI